MNVAPAADRSPDHDPAWRVAGSRLRFSFRSKLPVLLQAEVSECGLACLAMIAAAYGHCASLAELRRRFAIGMTGTSVRSLRTIASALDLDSRALRLETDELDRLRLPAVLHWRLDHFVVLSSTGRRGVTVHDPARGRRRVSWPEVSRAFTGVAIELYPAPGFKRRERRERVRLTDLWTRARGLGRSLALLVGLSALLQALALLSPLVNQLVVDEAIAKNDGDFLRALLIGFALLLLARTAIDTLRSFVAMHFGQMLSFQLRSNLLAHLFRLPCEFFERRHIGDVLSRLGSIGPVQRLISSGIVTLLLDGALAVTTGTVMFLYSAELATLATVIVVTGFLVRLATFPYVRRLTEEKIVAGAELESVLLESLRGVRSIKLAGRESQRHATWQNAFVETTNIGIRLQRFGISGGALAALLFGGLDLAVLYLGARAVIDGALTLGMLFAFQAYRAQFATRMNGLINLYFAFRTVGVHLERLADIAHTPQETATGRLVATNRRLRGNISLRAVSFRFADDQPWLFRDLNLDIAAGERVALVGESGGGKTTLIKILLGVYPVSDGEVLYDGLPIAAHGLAAIRAQVGVVLQDDRPLSGTIAENICFFDEEPDLARIAAAADAAEVGSLIRSLPLGLQTPIGDMGSVLSAGQTQRLLLARALYKRPRLLMLDEGTANLDADTESRVLAALSRLPVTQIVVAHRAAAIAASERVLRVEHGTVVTDATTATSGHDEYRSRVVQRS